jgi:hypothetical protein
MRTGEGEPLKGKSDGEEEGVGRIGGGVLLLAVVAALYAEAVR